MTIGAVGSCEYDDGHVKQRYRYDPELVVIDPDSGEVLIRDTIIGREPPNCPKTTSDTNDVHGGLPAGNFVNWLKRELP